MDDFHGLDRYLTVDELAAKSGLSTSTIWRLKLAGKIPFYQPAGRGGRVVFPADAIEASDSATTLGDQSRDDTHSTLMRLPGPQPKWMSGTTLINREQ